MIHTRAILDASVVKISADAVQAGINALMEGRPIYADSNMIKAGLSMARLQQANASYSKEKVHCHVADADIAAMAASSALPRSLFAVRKASETLQGGIALFGNACRPLELNRMIIEDISSALVMAMPVGLFMSSKARRNSLPFRFLMGSVGGVGSALMSRHALCISIAARKDHSIDIKHRRELYFLEQ
jgi:precorrin isomerase